MHMLACFMIFAAKNEGSMSSDEGRKTLNRRRLEEAHLKICMLDVFKRYPEFFPIWTIHTQFYDSLDLYAPVYYDAFVNQYAG